MWVPATAPGGLQGMVSLAIAGESASTASAGRHSDDPVFSIVESVSGRASCDWEAAAPSGEKGKHLLHEDGIWHVYNVTCQ